MEQINNTIYRYKFDELFLEDLISFSKIHQFDDRKTFKEEWKLWCESNEEFINREENRLISLGYKGDCKDKMFKSARYYFKNKKNTTYKLNKQLKTNYIPRNPVFFKMIETYINKNPIKASLLYKEFINETDTNILSEINTEIVRLKTFELNQTECLQKIKKMFNNAYYKIKKQLKKQQLDV